MNSHFSDPCFKVPRLVKSKHNHRQGNVTDLDSSPSGEQVGKVVGHTLSRIT